MDEGSGSDMEGRVTAEHLKDLTAPYFNSGRADGVAKLGRALLNLPLRIVGRPQGYFNEAVRELLSSWSAVLRSVSVREQRIEERLAAVETAVSTLRDELPAPRPIPPAAGTDANESAVTEWAMLIQPSRFEAIYSAPAHQVAQERTVPYAVVFGTQPLRSLEIGTLQGGSTVIICAALDDIGAGRIACVDPNPQVSAETWGRVSHRAVMIQGMSPDVVPKAAEAVGGMFDFAFIDGDHEREGVIRDIEGVLPLLAPSAYLMFHDAHYFSVREAIDEMLLKHRDCLSDCGMISARETPAGMTPEGRAVVWGGMRLLRFVRAS